MVDRWQHEFSYAKDPDGDWVDAADYDALAARLAEAERLLRSWERVGRPVSQGTALLECTQAWLNEQTSDG